VLDWWHGLTAVKMVPIKAGLAIAAAVLLVAGAHLAYTKREHVLRRTRDVLLATVGVASLCCYFNLFHFHFDDYLHQWDIYHYYVGAKYLPELGYNRLYECTVIAEKEIDDGHVEHGRLITDLTTNDLERVDTIVADPARCTDHFTPERWREFTADIAFFRSLFSPGRWLDEVLHDHGFNGTPVWALLGRPLASAAPASHEQLVWLAAIDPILLAIMFAVFAWGFGWRAACIAAVWFGTSYPTQWMWNGGAFLRQDWLVLAVVGVAMVKRGKPLIGGFALTYSALLRVFPGFIVAALVLRYAVLWVRERKITLSRELKRFAIGCVAAGALLVPASLLFSGGASTASEFVTNSRKHLDTPLTNNMGWKTVVAYDPDTRVRVALDPSRLDNFGRWKDARRAVFEQRRWVFYLGLVAFLALLAWGTVRAPDWAVLVLGVGLIPVAAELTCYYYTFILILAALWPERPLIGIAMCITSAATGLITRLAPWDDSRYYDMSCYVLLLVIASVVVYRVHNLRKKDRVAISHRRS